MVNMTPKEAYEEIKYKTHWKNLKYYGTQKINELEDIICTDYKYAYFYSYYIIGKRWEKGEDAISTDAEYSSKYAQNILEKRFPQGENVISKSSLYSYIYAQYVINGKWEPGEDIISKDPLNSYYYAYYVIKAPFEKGHLAIFNSSSSLKDNYIDFLKKTNYDLSNIIEWLI